MSITDAPNLVWMDLEMSGLNPETDSILEIASIITNSELETIAVGPEIVIKHDQSLFETMDDWNKTQHTKSGLWQKVIDSQTDLVKAEQQTLAFIQKHTDPKKSPLCGNTIYQDKRFLNKYMPRIEAYLHYRLVDVSTIKELSQRWYPELPVKTKHNTHRALDDIRESIEELRYYRDKVFIKNP